MEKLCTEHNLSDFWFDDSPGLPMNHIHTTLRDKYKAKFVTQWRIDLEESLSCISYDEFKDSFKLEPYLTKLNFGDRLIMAKFRCRSNYLPISDFKQFNDTYFVPECPFCQNDYADEEHYLLFCPHFAETRIPLLTLFPDLEEVPSQIKHILCSEVVEVLKAIAKFCKKFMNELKNKKSALLE